MGVDGDSLCTYKAGEWVPARMRTHIHSAHSWMSWMNGDFSQGNKMLRLELEALSCVFLFDWFFVFCPRYLEGARASSLLGWFLPAMDCYHQKQQTWMASFIPELLSQVCFPIYTYLSLRNLSGRSYYQLTRNICLGEWNFLLRMTGHKILKESHSDKACCQRGGWRWGALIEHPSSCVIECYDPARVLGPFF